MRHCHSSKAFLARRRRFAARCGFTLIELLVVIAIIAILAGLLVPALSKGKSAAIATECRGNLRDVGVGLRMYLDDGDVYPMAGGISILSYHEIYGLLQMDDWKEDIGPHLGFRSDDENTFLHARKLRCPQVLTTPGGGRGNAQYAYNGFGTAKFQSSGHLGLSGAEWRKPTHESQVLSPASMIAVGDVAPGPAEGKYFRSLAVFDVCSTNRAGWPGSHHNGQANMLFADGHVESARQATWISPDYSARARWNNDHEPHPETWKR